MTSSTFTYQPKLVDKIVIRDFAFEFPKDLNAVWCPDNPVRSHLFSGLSLVKPYLEPYLAKSTQAAVPHIGVPELVEDIKGFNGQEARHYQCHRRLNDLLKVNGYPEFAHIEKRMAKSYARLIKKSLQTQLAYNAGFECMTNGFTHYMIDDRIKLFGGASPHVTSFFLMHAVEETEHKTVAFDVYMAYSGKYLPRAIGIFHGSLHVFGYGLIVMMAALKKDKLLGSPRTWLSIAREVASLVGTVGPYLLEALLPWFNPRSDKDPEWMRDWIRGHAKLPKGARLPLVDTSDPAMPVPFTGLDTEEAIAEAAAERRRSDRRRSETIVDVASVLGFPDRRRGDRRAYAGMVGV